MDIAKGSKITLRKSKPRITFNEKRKTENEKRHANSIAFPSIFCIIVYVIIFYRMKRKGIHGKP